MRNSCQFHLLAALLLTLCTVSSLYAAPVAQSRNHSVNQVTAAYENATLSEDVSWSGTVIIKGSLTVAPQATLRIEPGTEIRFSFSKGIRFLPRLVVMGRIQAVGTLDRPVFFTALSATPAKRGQWGGILLLSSEKRNQLEHCRIEGAETALESRFSTFAAKSLSVSAATAGVVLYDSISRIETSNISGCDTGIESHDSEIELRDTSVAHNRRGMFLYRSSVVMSTVTVNGNTLIGLLAEECRIKMTSCEVSANKTGAHIKGGEGLLFMSRFVRNNETALHLALTRLKVNRCQFSDNLRDGMRLEDGRANLWGNSFSGNGNYNLVNAGSETISAVQNWWGAGDEQSITAKLLDAHHDKRYGRVNIFPWLLEKPTLLN